MEEGAHTMIPSRPTCVSWLLLASYAVLLSVGGVGVWMSVNNFGNEELLPPTPPQELEKTTTTTPDRYYSSYDENRIPETYSEYIYATVDFARASSDARLYVLLPCVVCVVVAAMVLVCGLWSRQFFSYTFSLYSSVSMWALTLTWAIIYQCEVASNKRMTLDPVRWVLAFQVVLMLLLSAQIVLSVWELRRQKAGWPTINFHSLFTVEALLLTARLTLTVFTFISLADSQIFRGYEGEKDPHKNFWRGPSTRFPLVVTLVCYGASCYNAVATIETILSVLLGKLHICLTTITSLLSALCCVTVAVLSSPVVIRMIIGSPYYIYPETMFFAIGLSVATFLHMMTCLAFPTSSRSLPDFLKTICRLMSTLPALGSNMVREQLLSSALPQIKPWNHLIFNLISAIFSLLSIIIIAAVWDSPLYRAWGSVLVLCANSATLVRTLPPFVTEFVFKETQNTSVNQRLMAISLESIALLVGASAICALSYGGAEIFTGVANLLFFAFQISIFVLLLKEKLQVALSEEAEHLAESEEVSS